MGVAKLVGKLVGKTKVKRPSSVKPKPKEKDTFASEMKALKGKAMTDAGRKAEAERIAKKYGKTPKAAAGAGGKGGGNGKKPPTKRGKKAKKLSPDKARRDLAVVGKEAQGLKTSLAAKQKALAKLKRDKAPADQIERMQAGIDGIKAKLGPINLRQVKLGKAKPIMNKPKKPMGKRPRAKVPAEKREISAGLIAAARAATGPTFTYRGKKYSKAVILKGAKK
tara:strand:- start:234 stop:902 length:669 start_codon:yes stop_codon:yes gene_type:complete